MISEKKKTLIVTLMFDKVSESFFEDKRKKYFPAYANFTKAHCTIFHCLPNSLFVIEKIKEQCNKIKSFEIIISKVLHNDNFVAYQIQSEKLVDIHETLQNDFKKLLSLKDSKKIKPHITISNKTTNFKAEKTYKILKENFQPFNANAIGISIWEYNKNKWEYKEDFLFT